MHTRRHGSCSSLATTAATARSMWRNWKFRRADTVAFAYGLLRIAGSKEPVCRLSIGLRKVRGKWLISHEHHSYPLEE